MYTFKTLERAQANNGCIVAALNQVVTRILHPSFNLLISVEELNIWLSCIIACRREEEGWWGEALSVDYSGLSGQAFALSLKG